MKPGARLKSAVDATEIVVVRAPSSDVDIRCGGWPMSENGQSRAEARPPDPRHSGGTQIGKRYANDEIGVEVLCTKAGEASLSIGDEPLVVKSPKPLPSSD